MAEHIPKHTIRKWLDNYDYLVHGGRPSDTSGNSGAKPVDGITNRQLTKIMLEDAISKLPTELQRVVYFRWRDKLPLSFVLIKLELTKDQYYYRCDKAVLELYKLINHL